MSFSNSEAQTAESVVQSFFTDIGGEENWRNLQSFSGEGRIHYEGLWYPIKIDKKLGKSRCELENKFVRGFDNLSFWKEVNGKLAADQETENNLLTAPFVTELLDYKKKGYKLELVSKTRINWRMCFNIQLVGIDSTGGPMTRNYFFGVSNFRLLRIIKPSSQGLITTWFSKYRKFSALRHPLVTRLQIDGHTLQLLKLRKVSFDVPMADELFTRPSISSWK